jgi:tetratricopeptide (TPR) repeat protein
MKRLLVCLLLVGVVGCGKSDADKARTELNKGVGLFDLKDWATAIACCNEAIRIKPDYAKAYYNRGVAHRKLGLDVKADADYAMADELGYEP